MGQICLGKEDSMQHKREQDLHTFPPIFFLVRSYSSYTTAQLTTQRLWNMASAVIRNSSTQYFRVLHICYSKAVLGNCELCDSKRSLIYLTYTPPSPHRILKEAEHHSPLLQVTLTTTL